MNDGRIALHYAEISNLLARVAHAADWGEVNDYMALMTDDIVFEFPANPNIDFEAATYRGFEEVKAGVLKNRGSGMQGPGTNTLHVVSTNAIELSGSSATADAYWRFYGDTPRTPRLLSMGRYKTQLRLTANGWRIAHRRIIVGG